MDTDGQTALFMVRHGQSTWNAERRWQGQANPPLSDFGRQQAFEASKQIGTVDAVVSSPQERALETAVIISTQIGVGPVQTVEGLREQHAGSWSGLTTSEIMARWPGWVEAGRRPEDWEPDAMVRERAIIALDSIVAEFQGATVLVVAHGGVILAVEDHLGVRDQRIPNLHGRALTQSGDAYRPGERIELLPPDLQTGGNTRSEV